MNNETYNDIPNKVWIVCYKGDSGNWLLSFPTIYYENAADLACVYSSSRETHILEFDLGTKIHTYSEMEKQLVKKIPKKKVRKVRQVV
jgi:hypothetical protein